MSSLRACRDLADAPAATVGDAVTISTQLEVVGQALHGFDCCPSDQPRALLGDVATAHGGVPLVVAGGQPSPRAEVGRPGEAGDVADLGYEYRGDGGSHPGDGLDHVVAAVAGEAVGNLAPQMFDLAVEGVDELQQGGDPCAVGGGQATWSSRARPALPNRSLTVTATPSLPSTACTWAFKPERSATSLAR